MSVQSIASEMIDRDRKKGHSLSDRDRERSFETRDRAQHCRLVGMEAGWLGRSKVVRDGSRMVVIVAG